MLVPGDLTTPKAVIVKKVITRHLVLVPRGNLGVGNNCVHFRFPVNECFANVFVQDLHAEYAMSFPAAVVYGLA